MSTIVVGVSKCIDFTAINTNSNEENVHISRAENKLNYRYRPKNNNQLLHERPFH